MVIYPVTTLRLAMGAIEDGLREIEAKEHNPGSSDRMQNRSRLYELLRYDDYNQFDAEIFNFSVKGHDQ